MKRILEAFYLSNYLQFAKIQWGPPWQQDTLYIYLGIFEKSYIIIREPKTMVLKYLARNSKLFKSDQSSSFYDILIYGEAVALVQPQNESNGRMQVSFRDRTGWIMKEHLSKDSVLEIYFIDVGQGDSTFIVTPARKMILIDGGANDRAMRFLAWKYRLEDPSASQLLIDLLVLTHADEDHIGGLVDVISHPRIRVNKIIHSGLAIYKDGVFNAKLGNLVVNDGTKYVETWHDQLNNLDESKLSTNFRNWKRAIEEDENTDYRAVDTSTGCLNIGDPNIKLEVLGPKTETVSPGNKKVYRWFGDHAHTINGHSVVLKLIYKDVSLLLAGDLNTLGEEHLLQDQVLAGKMDANILKAPHHGSHEFSQKWLDAVNPQISTISSGDDTDHGHPRAVFVGAVGNASRQPAHIFSTEIAANFVRFAVDCDRYRVARHQPGRGAPLPQLPGTLWASWTPVLPPSPPVAAG